MEIITQDQVSSLLQSEDPFPVDFDLAWQWIGYYNKQAARKKLKNNFVPELDYLSKRISVPSTNASGFTHKEEIFLTTDCFKSLAMMAGTTRGREVREYFLDIERNYRKELKEKQERLQNGALDPSIQSIIDFVTPVLTAAGMDKNHVLATITQAVAKQHPELKPTADFLIHALPPQPAETQTLTPTEIGELLTPQISARKLNPILEQLGLQEGIRDFKGSRRWVLTDKGKEHGAIKLERRADGGTVNAVCWRRSVVPIVQAELDKEQP